MENRIFDELTKSLAEGIPRREAMKRAFGVLAGAIVGTLGLAPGASAASPTQCKNYCKAHFSDPFDQNQCMQLCSTCASTRLLCGPRNRIDLLVCCATTCCAGTCVDLTSNPKHCGTCRAACPSNLFCVGGQCTCPHGATPCIDNLSGSIVCVDLNSNPFSCGACNNVCPQGDVCSNGVCTAVCSPPKTACGAACVDLTTDPLNCGACNVVCPQGTVCTAGTCTSSCPVGTTLCQGACVNLSSDPSNCGACGVACPQSEMCVSGACSLVCPPGMTICNGACVDLSKDVTNCGTCGNACFAANGQAVCQNGVCEVASCNAGFGDCNGNARDGCETNVNTDVNNCGTCGNVCSAPNATTACSGGKCVVVGCSAGFSDCNGNPNDGCETNVNTDVNNCGACGKVCSAPNTVMACSGGACVIVSCTAGFVDCNGNPNDGCETNITNDVNNCGACGFVCQAAQSCIAGTCM